MSIIPDWLFDGNARDEDDTPRDGFLSTSVEIHAAVNGFFKGFVGKEPTAVEPDSERERHYFRGFYLAGRGVQLLVAAIAGGAFL